MDDEQLLDIIDEVREIKEIIKRSLAQQAVIIEMLLIQRQRLEICTKMMERQEAEIAAYKASS